ncbi:CU044_5270 family protein [Streptomyces sp. NPDC056486]|uniref:CU044_5270 family protein n=1 Tax=Streptomyces sp. NPDC056486 TaxID=3345835 RepID=UPI0036A5E242
MSDDELDLLRRADPVPAASSRFADGPLDVRAERQLDRLLGRTPDDPIGGRRRIPWRTPRPRLLWAVAATAIVVAGTFTALVGGPGAQPAVAAPRPLTVHARSEPLPLAQLAELAAEAADDGSPRLRKGTHTQSWALGMADGEAPITLPEERIVRWRADDSHTALVVATDPRHPGSPVLTDTALDAHTVPDGHVISRTTYPPSWSDAPPESTPPHTPAALRAYLTEVVHPGRPASGHTLSTGELIDATAELLGHWTLGARESAALTRLLADTGDLRPVGEVKDRLGRPGQAYVLKDGDRGSRRMLVLDPRTGAVLGLETTVTRDDPEYGLRAGDVMEYTAWMR